MTLDPAMAAVLEQLKDVKPMELMSLDELRASVAPAPIALRQAVASAGDLVVAETIPARLYTPMDRRCDSLIVYFHGGGFVLGSLETHDHVSRDLCHAAGCALLAVDYRLAPEHPFPAASDDCLAAVRWAAEHAASLGASPRRVVVAGDSAGANLATVTTLRLRDEGGPRVSGQVLAYPVTNYHTPATASYIENASGYSLTRAAMIRFWRDYVASEEEARHPFASPLMAPDLSGLPPALVMTAQYDPLRDEGDAYAARLEEHGVRVRLVRYDGLIHGFLRMAAVSARVRQAFDDIGAWIRALPPSGPADAAPSEGQDDAARVAVAGWGGGLRRLGPSPPSLS